MTSLLCNKIYYYPKIIYTYRLRSGSSYNCPTPDISKMFYLLDFLEDFLKANNLYEKNQEQLNKYKITVGVINYNLTPIKLRNEYIKTCKKHFSSSVYKKFLNTIQEKRNFLQNIFSIKNDYLYNIKYKVVKLFGLTYSFEDKDKKAPCYEAEARFQIIPSNKDNESAIILTIDKQIDNLNIFNSLISHLSKDKNYDIIILEDEISSTNKDELKKVLPNNLNLKFFDMNNFIKTHFAKIKLKADKSYPYSIFYKYFIPFITQYYKKVLYINKDINKSINKFLNIDFMGNEAVALFETDSKPQRLYCIIQYFTN